MPVVRLICPKLIKFHSCYFSKFQFFCNCLSPFLFYHIQRGAPIGPPHGCAYRWLDFSKDIQWAPRRRDAEKEVWTHWVYTMLLKFRHLEIRAFKVEKSKNVFLNCWRLEWWYFDIVMFENCRLEIWKIKKFEQIENLKCLKLELSCWLFDILIL